MTFAYHTGLTDDAHKPAYRTPSRTGHRENVPRRSLRRHRRDAALSDDLSTDINDCRQNNGQRSVTLGPEEVFEALPIHL
jgi:hypothetical protein